MVKTNSFRLLPSERTLLVFFLYLSSWLHRTEAKCASCACDSTICCFEVVEEEPAGIFVGNLNEVPKIQSSINISNFGYVTYNLVTQNSPLNVNMTSGIITTSQPIDREGLSESGDCLRTQVDVNVYAIDTLLPTNSREVFVVHVTDINDNAPEFQLGINVTQLTGSVPETGPDDQLPNEGLFCSPQLRASDADLGNNASITYKVVKPSDGSFEVYKNDNKGLVCLRNLLAIDYEKNQSIVIVVEAEDSGASPMTSNVSVHLTVTDINDNIPVFKNVSVVYLNVSETLPVGSEIAMFVATDADTGNFGEVTYIIPSPSVLLPFTLNETTGVLYLAEAQDADTMTDDMCNYHFYIEAIDGGGMKSDQLEICTNIINENDNLPKIVNTPTESFLYLIEGPQDNSVSLATYFLQDGDKGQEVNSHLDQEEYFRIELVGVPPVWFRFELFVNVSSIDREMTPSINVSITFVDTGIPPLAEILNVTVIINDINDNVPSLTRTNFTVVENATIGFPIIDLIDYFSDPDYGANGTYGSSSLLAVTSNLFTIENDHIAIKQRPDREKDGDVITIMVKLSDNGEPVMSAEQTLYISILDVNDNSPVFQNVDERVLTVIENQAYLQNITIIEAIDADLGENGSVHYSLTNNSLNLFHIDNITGQLSATGDFDREMQESYRITVVASDQGVIPNLSLLNLTITVTDTNDWNPEFDPGDDSFTISVEALPHTLIGSVFATDRDTGSNAAITYSLSGNGSQFFSINSTGMITTSKDFEDVTPGMMKLLVTASNTYQQNMSDTKNITINVTPVEDNVLLMYIIPGAAVPLLLAIITLIVLLGLVYYCRTHTKKKTLNKTSNRAPRRSSLRPTPSVGKDNVTITSNNGTGTFSRSPTVNFRPDSEVAYYNREQAITKSEFETHTVPVQHGEEKGADKDIDSPQIPTKESPSQAKHVPPSRRLSDDLSSSSTTSNPPDYSPFYSQHTSQHSTVHQTMVLSEDALKEHNRVYSEGGGMLSDSTARYLATVEEPIDRDDGSTYTDATGGIHSVIRSYYPPHRSNQSISIPVSQYVSQNGTPPSADSSPNLHYVPTHGSSTLPGVYYKNTREPITSHRRMMVMSDDALHDHMSTASRYEPTMVTSSSHHMMASSNGMATVGIERYSSSSPETQAEEELDHAPLPPTHYPMHYPIPHRSRSRDHLPPVHVRTNGSIPQGDLAQYPSRLNMQHGSPRQRSYQYHQNLHPHPSLPPSHTMQEKRPPPPPYSSYHSFAASEDNSTMASSILDQYLVFDHDPSVRQFDLTLSVDDMGLSSIDPENKRPRL